MVNPKKTAKEEVTLNAQEMWQQLARRVEISGDLGEFRERLAREPRVIVDILQALREQPGKDRHFKLNADGDEVMLSWHDRHPNLSFYNRNKPVDFIHQVAGEFEQHAGGGMAHAGGRRKSLSDLAMARYSQERLPYRFLGGDDEFSEDRV